MDEVVERPLVRRMADDHDATISLICREIGEELSGAIDDVPVALAAFERFVDVRPPGTLQLLDLHTVHSSVVAFAKSPVAEDGHPDTTERDVGGLYGPTEIRREHHVDRAGMPSAELARLLPPYRRELPVKPAGRDAAIVVDRRGMRLERDLDAQCGGSLSICSLRAPDRAAVASCAPARTREREARLPSPAAYACMAHYVREVLMRRALRMLIVVTIVVAAVGAASAHPANDFDACAAHRRRGGFCESRGVAYAYGTTVHIRAHVSPSHASETALVLRKKPYSTTWRVVDEVFISDTGRMRWAWHTTIDDAVQRRPYEFRFRIADHGVSNRVEAYVLFGE